MPMTEDEIRDWALANGWYDRGGNLERAIVGLKNNLVVRFTFTDRKCIVQARPVTDQDGWQKVASAYFSQMEPETASPLKGMPRGIGLVSILNYQMGRLNSEFDVQPTEEETEALAARLHAGQVDWAGIPYVEHTKSVRDLLGPDASDTEKLTALLHDVLEDGRVDDGTPEGRRVTPEDLYDLGYGDEVVNNVRMLTRDDIENEREERARLGMSSTEFYLKKIRELCALAEAENNAGVLKVKRADNTHNSCPERAAGLEGSEDRKRNKYYNKRYVASISIIDETLGRMERAPGSKI